MQGRPKTLAEVASRAESLEQFGRELADWMRGLRAFGSRPALCASVAEEPRWLCERFPGGELADATLAAYADFLASLIAVPPPAWTGDPARVAPEPWFAVDGPKSRLLVLRDTPPAFKRRNLFTPTASLPVRLRAGRPPKSIEERRAGNAERQRRFQRRRRELLRQLLERGPD